MRRHVSTTNYRPLQMNTQKKSQVIFLQAVNSSAKLQAICDTVARHFFKSESVLIIVASDEAAAYLDLLLWRMPEESFIPHAIVGAPSKERIAISKEKSNFNRAKVLINLRPEAAVSLDEADIIYDLMDLTDASKEELSRQRQNSYQAAGYICSPLGETVR
jgi:DNA polymerase-3 subunit chi